MDRATVSRQNNAVKKRNKENVQPVPVGKSFIKQNILKAAPPVQPNENKKAAKQSERRQVVGERSSIKTAALKSAASAGKPTHSRDFKKEQDAKFKKLVGEAPKPAAPKPPRAAPGTYKGRVIESKIGSIWKSSVPSRSEDQKSFQKAVNVSAPAAGRGSNAVKPGARPPIGFPSARPPARSVPAAARPKNATAAQGRRCGSLIAKPNVPVTDKKASKPPAASAISQYRANNETAEEKRAKLAEWLASKGKTLKRPAMKSTAAATKNKMPNTKPAAAAKSQVATKSEVKEEPGPASATPALAADHQDAAKTDKRVSFIMNTTLDLLENSDLELPVDPQDGGSDRVDDIVINLCDALEALEPPSRCASEPPPPLNECDDGETKTGREREAVKSETPDNATAKSEDGDDQEVTEESEGSDEDCYVKENAAPMEDASVVKYSVRTTPFLQSVKKTIEDEVCCSTSKRKSNIKDLKFLTPVRRSSRISRQSSRLPLMLADHDPCVSSLAELVMLDDDANAYIYRKNPALLEDLPDQPRV